MTTLVCSSFMSLSLGSGNASSDPLQNPYRRGVDAPASGVFVWSRSTTRRRERLGKASHAKDRYSSPTGGVPWLPDRTSRWVVIYCTTSPHVSPTSYSPNPLPAHSHPYGSGLWASGGFLNNSSS